MLRWRNMWGLHLELIFINSSYNVTAAWNCRRTKISAFQENHSWWLERRMLLSTFVCCHKLMSRSIRIMFSSTKTATLAWLISVSLAGLMQHRPQVQPITQVRSDGWHLSYMMEQNDFAEQKLVMFMHLLVFLLRLVVFPCWPILVADSIYFRVTLVDIHSMTSHVTLQSYTRLCKVSVREGQPSVWTGPCPMSCGTSSMCAGNKTPLNGHRW